jgi:hypothetical protein
LTHSEIVRIKGSNPRQPLRSRITKKSDFHSL